MLQKVENKQISINEIERMAMAFKSSGMFYGITNEQAVVKILAGQELGLPPFASVSGIHVVNGKPTISAALISTLIANSYKYSYKVKTTNAEICEIEFFNHEDGAKVSAGISSFSIEEARQAKLTNKDVWKSYASDMLFARAVTRGARRFCPGIFGGSPIFTPEELEDVKIKTIAPEPAPLLKDSSGDDLVLINDSVSIFIDKSGICENIDELKNAFSTCWKTLKSMEEYKEAQSAMFVVQEVVAARKEELIKKKEELNKD